ncbi:hypothetical protein GH733_010452 [Mirounga leonina]|nr:hypothetical protein GH733_010452 [Mirounga leonina]
MIPRLEGATLLSWKRPRLQTAKECDSTRSCAACQADTSMKPLSAFTVCLRAYTALSRPYSLFSYATRAQHNEILLFREKIGLYSVSVGGSDIYFKVPETFYTPRHFCVTWESSTGITELWVDGKPMVRMSLKKGYSVGAGASIILGQEQDSFGGGFDTNQSLVGDIGDVNMWDYVLSPHDISTVHIGGVFSPNILNWQNLKYSTRGPPVLIYFSVVLLLKASVKGEFSSPCLLTWPQLDPDNLSRPPGDSFSWEEVPVMQHPPR